jgi:hypothetical protein
VRFDKWTYIIGIASVGAAAVLGVLSEGWPGALAAFAGLIPAILWQIANDRWKGVRDSRRLLHRADERLTPPVIPGGPVSHLRPEAKVVRFWPRPELATLHAWAASPNHADIQLIIGEGGAGKTRLALQLGQELSETYGWRSYWISAGDEVTAIAAARESQVPVLLIVDYAETRADISKLLTAIIKDALAVNIRLLLLARSAGEWWQLLITGSSAIISETLSAVQPIILGPLSDPSGQEEVFRQALQAFADELNTDCPSDAQLPTVGLRAPALVVHAAALLAVLEHQQNRYVTANPGDRDIIAALLRHEARYWQQSQASYGLALEPVVTRRTVAAGVLVGADDEDSATQLLTSIPELADPAIRGRAARWLHDLYPPELSSATEQEWIAPLRPDLVAEKLVVDVLRDHLHLAQAMLSHLTARRATRALTVLGRAALSDPTSGDLIRHVLTINFSHLVVPALAVAVETNPHLGEYLANLMESEEWPPEFVEQIARALPRVSVALARTAVATFKRLADASDHDSPEHALYLANLSSRLGELGHRDGALTTVVEAVAAYRNLARVDPDTFLPDLATSLNNQAGHLSELGHREDALRVIHAVA